MRVAEIIEKGIELAAHDAERLAGSPPLDVRQEIAATLTRNALALMDKGGSGNGDLAVGYILAMGQIIAGNAPSDAVEMVPKFGCHSLKAKS